MSKQQTAVEWLVEQFAKYYSIHQSDEEIEKASRQINYGGGSEGWIKDAFRKGAKWMQQELNKQV